MARLNLTQTRTAAAARTVPTYPRTPVGGVYIPGAKSIEGATGDIARTTTGWIENEKYKWYAIITAAAFSAEFDTAVTRTGAKTLKLSTTDTTGRADAEVSPNGTYQKYGSRIKASTQYIFNCYVKTTNVATNSVFVVVFTADSTGTYIATTGTTNKLSGTNDWTLCTATFTTAANAAFAIIRVRNIVAGNISDAWFDTNSLTLTEVLPRNPVA